MKKHIRTPGRAATVFLIFLAIIAGYTAMWSFGYYTPNADNFQAIFIQLIMIAVVFAIAYAILKGIFHFARLNDREERELKIKDLPKNAPEPVNTARYR